MEMKTRTVLGGNHLHKAFGMMLRLIENQTTPKKSVQERVPGHFKGKARIRGGSIHQ